MTIGSHINRKVVAFLATAAAAALSAPAALADPPQGHKALAQPDLVERYVASGRGQADVIERWVDGRAGHPDLIERYVEIRRPVGFPDGRPDGYQPQTRTAAAATTASVEGGFSWSDAGIGALAGFALTLLAAGGMLATRTRRRIAHS
jgi:hypothetical protein